MGTGGRWSRIARAHARAWLAVLALQLAFVAPVLAQDLILERLDADPPAAEVLAGRHDVRLEPQAAADVLFEVEREPRWWRITARKAIPAASEPRLVLDMPHSTRVQAWVPGGNAAGTWHALHGPGADRTHASRALVIALPQGLQARQPLWLRVHAPAGFPMPVSVLPRDEVHRADLAHVAWRSANLTALLVLGVLGIGFWFGTGDRSYGFLSGMMVSAAAYLAIVGGEARTVPVLDEWLGGSAQPARMAAFLGIICSNLFQQRYLEMPRRLPRLHRLLWLATLVLAGLCAVTLSSAAAWVAAVGNVVLLVSAFVVVAGSVRLSLAGDRPALLLLASWLPLAVVCMMRALELMGLWTGPPWLAAALSGSFVLSGLLLTLGLADKLLELRRDRDLASARADVDALTGVDSRPAIERSLLAAVAASAAGGTPLSVAFVDLDDFKQVNDLHGHQVGDDVLREVCQRVRGCLRPGDRVGRYGGDELLLVMPRAGLDEALGVSERMREAVDVLPVTVDAVSVRCSLSLGVAELQPGEGAAALLLRADAALYACKALGRNRVCAAPVQGVAPVAA